MTNPDAPPHPSWMQNDWLGKGWKHNLHDHPTQSAYMDCVLVESRAHPWLPQVISNFSCMFPRARFTIMYNREHDGFFRNCVDHSQSVRMVPLSIEGTFDIWSYCKLLATPRFWDLFLDSERVLVFQADTGIRKNRILRYLEYSYIGAPWGGAPEPLDPWIHLGNGGLSLRDPRLMKDVCNRFPYCSQDIAIEDLYFSQRVANMDAVCWPEKDVAAAFSMEHVIHEDPMGFHQIYNWHPRSVLDPLLSNCDPEYPVHSIHELCDVWVEASNGWISAEAHLRNWAATGIGPRGLVIPKDTLVPFNEHEAMIGHSKQLVVVAKDAKGDIHEKRIPLRRKRTIEGACLS